jgi:hypothetical protein
MEYVLLHSSLIIGKYYYYNTLVLKLDENYTALVYVNVVICIIIYALVVQYGDNAISGGATSSY